MSSERPRMHEADEAILEDLLREQPDYIPLVANRLGMHVTYVEKRCDLLTEYDLIRTVTNEVVYAVTDRGEAYLDGELDPTDVADSGRR